MKQVVFVIGILCLISIIIVNIIYTTYLNTSEQAIIHVNSLPYILGVIITGIFIYGITEIIDKNIHKNENIENKKKLRKKLKIGAFLLYIVFQVLWVIFINPKVVGDAVHVCNLAQTFYGDQSQNFLQNPTYAGVTLREYMQAYPHQITLAFVYSIFFKIIHFDIMEILRILNVIGNIAIVIAIYKIGNQLAKTYKINKVRLGILILTFVSLPMLSTYIYGDIPSLALCLFSVYFMMRYIETDKPIYPIGASILTMIAYMMRMNSLIFMIATVIYLVMNIVKKGMKLEWKKRIRYALVIILYISISIFPSSLVKNNYFHQYDLDKNKIYPNESYILMGIEEGTRGNGWYNETIAEPAIENPKEMKIEYIQEIKDRVTYFSKNPKIMFQFYTNKIASMWTENTYAAIRNNCTKEGDFLENLIVPLTFYQKAILLLISVSSIILLIQKRKHLSYEWIFLLTIFIGGFTFHILWEAKSRYIIPYIVVLIPIASMYIDKTRIQKWKNKLTQLQSK